MKDKEINVQGFLGKPFYVNFPRIIAEKNSRLVSGERTIFNAKDDKISKILTNFWDKENGQEKLRKATFNLSLWGKSIMYVWPNEAGELSLKFVRNPFNSRISKIDEKEQIAIIWDTLQQNDAPIWRKMVVTPTEMRIEFYAQAIARVGEVSAEPRPAERPYNSYSLANLMGFLPFIELENKSIGSMYLNSTTNINNQPDWINSSDLILKYQEMFRIAMVELKANRTRIAANVTSEKLLDIKSKGGYALEDVYADALIQGQFNTAYGSSSMDSSFQVLEGKPNLDVYTGAMEAVEAQIFNNAGWTPFKSSSNGVYENKTTSLFSDKLDIETTLFKQAILKPKLEKLFDFVLKFNGIDPFEKNGERKYSFDFIQLSMIDRVSKIEEQEKLINMGVVSQAEARAIIFGIPMALAEKQIEQVQKVNMANKKSDLELQGKFETANKAKLTTKEDK